MVLSKFIITNNIFHKIQENFWTNFFNFKDFKIAITPLFPIRRVWSTVRLKALSLRIHILYKIHFLFSEFIYLLLFKNRTFGCIFGSLRRKSTFFEVSYFLTKTSNSDKEFWKETKLLCKTALKWPKFCFFHNFGMQSPFLMMNMSTCSIFWKLLIYI